MINILVPSDFCNALQKHVAKGKLSSMKAQDWHVLMQQILPLCTRRLLCNCTIMAIMRLSHRFRRICTKVISPVEIDDLRYDSTTTLCMLKMEIFFINVMTRLVLHVVDQLDLLETVHIRWMYKVFKSFVKNMTTPEATIAKCYLMEETIRLVT